MLWTEELFGVKKPILAMLHLDALPGDPRFRRGTPLGEIVEHARADLHALQDGGVDGIIFSNEFSFPYQRKMDMVTPAAMAYIIGALRSEVGVLYLNPANETIVRRAILDHSLRFTPLYRAQPHVFISKRNPLAEKEAVRLEDLADYPRLSYEQGAHNAFYYAEEIQSTLPVRKDIVVTDRATLFNLLIGLDGYTISSGIINEELNGEEIIARPLLVDDFMEIGYLTHAHIKLSRYAGRYIEKLCERIGNAVRTE